MERLNQEFQPLLIKNDFPMKVSFENGQWLYKGKLEVTDYHILDFAVAFSQVGESDGAVCQILFNNVAYCKSYEKRGEWLDFLNQLNVEMGLYYYLCLENDGRIFARYITEVYQDVETVYNVLNAGVNVMIHVLEKIESKFGPIVSI